MSPNQSDTTASECRKCFQICSEMRSRMAQPIDQSKCTPRLKIMNSNCRLSMRVRPARAGSGLPRRGPPLSARLGTRTVHCLRNRTRSRRNAHRRFLSGRNALHIPYANQLNPANTGRRKGGLAALCWSRKRLTDDRNIGLGQTNHDWSSHTNGADGFGLICIHYDQPDDSRTVPNTTTDTAMAQRAEIDLNSEDGGFAFRQWGMSISFRLRNNQIRQTQFPMGLPKENAPIWQPQHRKPKLARAYAETTLMAMVAHGAINLSSSCDHLLGDDGYDPAPGIA